MYPGIDTHWTLYVDPVTSIVLTGLILYTTLGLLKGKNMRFRQINLTLCIFKSL